MGTHWGVLLAPEFRPRFRLVGIVWVGKQPVGISSPLTSRTTSRFYPNFPRILRFYSSATIRRSRPGKSWCPDFNSIPSGFNIKDTCYTVPYSARTSFGLGVGMILMFMSRRQRYDWRLILFVSTACYSRLPVGWPILALDILQFSFWPPRTRLSGGTG